MGFSRKERLLLGLVPPAATLLLRLLCATLRFRESNDAGACPADRHPGTADTYVFWHRALLLAAYRYRGLGIHILISASFDGELIARVVQRLGFVPVRGSSSRGGAAGLLQLTRARDAGHKVAITADGPRGPLYVAKAGAAAVALHTGGSVSCFHLHGERAWLLRSWDRFIIPKPFSRVCISWSAPLALAGLSNVAATAHIQAALAGAVARAEGNAATGPGEIPATRES